MAFLLVTAFVLFLLFAYVDVWYLIRFFVMIYLGRQRRRDLHKSPYTKKELTRTSVTSGIVLPSDIDAFLHMNNSKYMREFDLCRASMAAEIGFIDIVQKHGGFFAMNAGSIRYRRSMKLFQRYTIETQIVGWDDDSIYMEQRMKSKNGFVSALLLSKFAVRGITVEKCISEMCGDFVPSPEPSPDMKAWIESVDLSSKKLRSEAGLNRSPSVRELSAVSLQR